MKETGEKINRKKRRKKYQGNQNILIHLLIILLTLYRFPVWRVSLWLTPSQNKTHSHTWPWTLGPTRRTTHCTGYGMLYSKMKRHNRRFLIQISDRSGHTNKKKKYQNYPTNHPFRDLGRVNGLFETRAHQQTCLKKNS